jgi:hypothetical protein
MPSSSHRLSTRHGRPAPHVPPLYGLITSHGSASRPRWARSRRSRWHCCSNGDALVPCSRNCVPGMFPEVAGIGFPEVRLFRYPALSYPAHSQEETPGDARR